MDNPLPAAQGPTHPTPRPLKIITTEEHFLVPRISSAYSKKIGELAPHFQDAFNQGDRYLPTPAQLADISAGRIADMDKYVIDMQVLSFTSPGVQLLAPEEAMPLTRQANDILFEAITQHPTRFAGFATLPTTAPAEAAKELERCVEKQSFKALMINGRTNDLLLDHPSFAPILEAAVALKVPICIHPTVPAKSIQEHYYGGLDPLVSMRFATAGWG